ncbi:hypothetical protein D3C73_736190 [compost metagenome]
MLFGYQRVKSIRSLLKLCRLLQDPSGLMVMEQTKGCGRDDFRFAPSVHPGVTG